MTPNSGFVRFIQGTDPAGTYKTVYTAGTAGSECFSYIISQNDQSQTHYLYTQIFRGGVGYIMSSYLTVIGTGGPLIFGPPVDLFSGQNFQGLGRDLNGNSYLFLAPGDTLRATFLTNLSSNSEIDLMIQCRDL